MSAFSQIISFNRTSDNIFGNNFLMYGFWMFLLSGMGACHPAVKDSKEPADTISQIEKDTPLKFDLEDIKERGSLIAVIDNSTTGYFLYNGQAMGYEYELLSRLTEDLGVKLELLVTTDIQEAIDMLNRGECDVVDRKSVV